MHAVLASMGVSYEQAESLRRASLTLHRWAEGECGSSGTHASWCIERDEKTGRPQRVTYPHAAGGKVWRLPIPDREAGALRRIARILTPLGLNFFHQGDPRGCALYVSREPLTDSTYNRGVAVG